VGRERARARELVATRTSPIAERREHLDSLLVGEDDDDRTGDGTRASR
jgi:hypothetical protein